MNTEILNLILLTLQAQENTINTLQEELSAIKEDQRIAGNYSVRKVEDHKEQMKKLRHSIQDLEDTLEDTTCDIENLDRQVNDNESNLECLESRFCEFKEITEKKSDSELEGRIEKIETWVDTHQYNSIVNEDDLKTAIINLLS